MMHGYLIEIDTHPWMKQSAVYIENLIEDARGLCCRSWRLVFSWSRPKIRVGHLLFILRDSTTIAMTSIAFGVWWIIRADQKTELTSWYWYRLMDGNCPAFPTDHPIMVIFECRMQNTLDDNCNASIVCDFSRLCHEHVISSTLQDDQQQNNIVVIFPL